MPEPSPRVTVVVVQRETFAHTLRAIESLYATAGEPFALIYVDGGSPPAVQRAIEDASRRYGFRLLRRERFLGTNEARNLGLTFVDTEFVAFVDNDLIFRDGWLLRMRACADETGADVVGPLLCIDEPPFRRIHVAGGDAHIEETSAGRVFHATYRFGHVQVSAVSGRLTREPLEMVEMHCMLVRRSALERAGGLDDGLLNANEHMDLCMRVRENGGTVVFEPSAVVNQLLPRLFPFDRQSLPFLRERWSRRNNRATIDRFQALWNLQPGDHYSEETYHWGNDRPDVIFRYLRPRFFRHGIRKLRRLSRHLTQRA